MPLPQLHDAQQFVMFTVGEVSLEVQPSVAGSSKSPAAAAPGGERCFFSCIIVATRDNVFMRVPDCSNR